MLKNVVFDLDGTLWQTTDSYVYAYHKLCDFYGIQEKVSDEIVKTYLGVRLDKLLNELFPTVEDKHTLAYRALGCSVEYLTQHPQDCCFDNVTELLKKLHENYDVYIVSNCLKEYVEAFLKISGTQEYIKAFYTIEFGEKSQHIQKIASNNEQEKTLFVGDCDDDYLSILDHYQAIFAYAAYGYKPCEKYDYKITKPMELMDVIEKINIKERQLQGKKYRVFSQGDNQITLIHNNNATSYFGYVQHANEGIENVIEALKNHFQTQKDAGNTKELIGPINGNTFYDYRFAVDHFDVKFYPDCNNEKQIVDVFKKHGFTFRQHYVSTIATVNERMWKLSKRAKLPEGYWVKVVSGREAFAYLDAIYEVTIDAFSDADYYEEINKKDFVELYMKNIDAVSPDVVLIFDKEELVGYNFCYQDPLKRYYVCKTTAIKKANRNKSLIMIMVDYSYTLLVEKGYQYALHHFQNDRTKTLHAIFRGHEVLQKRYALMEWKGEK